MGKVLDFGYRSLHSQKLADKATSQKPAGAQVSEVSEPASKVERAEVQRAGVKQVLNARSGRGPGRMFTKATGRAAGQRGGRARSKNLAPEQRQDIARRAAASRWGGKGAR